MKPRRPIRKVSKVRQKQMADYAKVKAKFLRDHPNCFVCGKWVAPVRRELHHFYGRLGRLLAWEPGFRSSCAFCHCRIHIHLDWARDNGYICQRGMWDDYNRAVEHEEVKA